MKREKYSFEKQRKIKTFPKHFTFLRLDKPFKSNERYKMKSRPQKYEKSYKETYVAPEAKNVTKMLNFDQISKIKLT